MSMPWDSPAPQPQRSYTPPPAPSYPPAPPPRTSPSPAQSMRPDIPAPAPQPRNNDLQTMIQNAINEAVVANKDRIQANAQRALVKTVKGEKAVIEHRKVVQGDGSIDEIEDSFEGGPVTTRTFFQGMAVDVGFAVMAALGTALTPGFNAFDQEAWTITGVLILKTVLTTGMSYAMSLQVK